MSDAKLVDLDEVSFEAEIGYSNMANGPGVTISISLLRDVDGAGELNTCRVVLGRIWTTMKGNKRSSFFFAES
jgi:hypothetical protein